MNECLLQNSKQLFPNLNAELAAALENSRDFVNVLSAPHLLPTVQRAEIPGLRADFQLRPYQLEGVTWLRFLATYGLNGILADDMGLGEDFRYLFRLLLRLFLQERRFKWVSCCRILLHPSLDPLAPLDPTPRALRPAVADRLPAHASEPLGQRVGALLPRRDVFRQIRAVDQRASALQGDERSARAFVRGTPREHQTNQVSPSSSHGQWSVDFSPMAWNYVVLDEGHCIRNPNTQLFEALESLITKRKLLLSGTPVQNSPADLWALFRFVLSVDCSPIGVCSSFLMPDYLGSRSAFQSRFLRPILACRNPKASEQQTKVRTLAHRR